MSLRKPRLAYLAVITALAAGLTFTGSAAFAQDGLQTAIKAYQEERYDDAGETLRALIAQDEENTSALYWLGRVLLATKKFDEAKTTLERVLAIKPDSADSHYWLAVAHIEAQEPEQARVALERALELAPDHVQARLALNRLAPPEEAELTLQAELAPTHAIIGDRGQISFTDHNLGVPVGEIDIQSAQVHDYTFSYAPVDWIARGGEWATTSRWTCSPQWSWFGGYAPDGVGTLWNKRHFAGDIAVELYIAFKMRVGRNPTYLHPNDINITICGDGVNPDSGYSFILGGERNKVTRIMRKNQVLAETSTPEALWPIYEDGQPPTYEWHRNWWSLRAHRRGNILQLFFDERLVLEAYDPDPLPDGYAAIWVYQNDFVTPRIKIYAEKEKLPRAPMADQRMVFVPNKSVAERHLAVTSESHPSLQNDFSIDMGTVSSRDADQGATLSIEAAPDGRGPALRLVNAAAGGTFGATLYPGEFDLARYPRLSFDYILEPDVFVNFYLKHDDKWYEIVFRGPHGPAAGYHHLGTIPNVAADGSRQRASFDLLGALQALKGPGVSTKVADLWVGNANEENYLMAGFGGNRGGATWWLDNVYIGRPGGGEVALKITPHGNAKPDGYAVSVSRDPAGPLPEENVQEESTVTVSLPDEGMHYVHVRPRLGENGWGTPLTYKVAADNTPPRLVRMEPQDGATFGGERLALYLDDPGGSGIDLKALRVRVGEQELGLDSPAVAYDPVGQVVTVRPGEAGIVFEDGQEVSVGISALADRAGNSVADTPNMRLVVNHGKNTVAPPAPQVTIGSGYLVDDDFENDMGEWESWGGSGGAILSRDPTTAASGQYSLRLTNPAAGSVFGAYVLKRPFDAGKHRIVSFDYRIDDRIRTDFSVFVNGELKGIRFTDNDNNLKMIGEVPNVQRDGRWHRTSFNLYDMLRKDDPDAPNFIVTQFTMGDFGWRGNRPGSYFNIDDFQIIPVISGAQPVQVAWNSHDAIGIAGVNWQVSPLENVLVPREVRDGERTLNVDMKELVTAWMHVRAADRAGNWSEPTRRMVLVDSAPPEAHAQAPAAGHAAATSEIILSVVDQGLAGLDPSSVRLQVADTEYTVDGKGLRYEPRAQRLVWNCERVHPTPVVFPDGKQVDIKLLAAADYAGNPAITLPTWNWTMDYSLDTTPPHVAEVHSTTHPTFLAHTFCNGVEGWTNRDGENGGKVEWDQENKVSGNGSVRITNQKAGGHMQVTINPRSYVADRYPHIAFDYKIPESTKLSLMFLVEGRWHAVTLNDEPTDVIGRVPNIVADNTWRRAVVDIMPMLRRVQQRGAIVVQQVIIGDRNKLENPAGAVANFDNFVIGKIGDASPVLRWRATDTTGIDGYSFAIDREPTVMPDTTSQGQDVAKAFGDMEPGLWFFSIRALDGAGNWGEPTTYALMHKKMN